MSQLWLIYDVDFKNTKENFLPPIMVKNTPPNEYAFKNAGLFIRHVVDFADYEKLLIECENKRSHP